MHISFEQFQLSNGLEVLVHEDRSVPKVSVNILYKVGSKNESPERTGFAHLFEHLMFEGSQHIPHYDTSLQYAGGQSNAFTNVDITNYYINIPSNKIETAFWLESDRMLQLDFSQEKLDIQKSVVIEEFKQRYLNQAYGDAHIKLRDLHYTTHPYQWPTIGRDISHIEEASLDDVKNFFFGFYAPNNAVMVVAGDTNSAEVSKLAEKWFGGIPRRELLKKALPQEPRQTTARSMETQGKVPLTGVYKMYHMPARTDDDYYVADIITDILSYGKGSRLFQHMVKEKQLSPSISAFIWGMHDPGVLSIDGKVAEGKTVEAYEQELQSVLEGIQDLKEEELQRVKNKLKALFVMQKTRILNRAMGLALSQCLGNPNLINETTEIYEQISLHKVKELAANMLSPDNCSTLYYQPENV